MFSSQTLLYVLGGALLLFLVFTIFHSPISRRIALHRQSVPRAKRFSDEDAAKIEAYLAGKRTRTRDLALLFVLHEAALSYSQIGRLTLQDPASAGSPLLAVDSRTLHLSHRANEHVLKWISGKTIKAGAIVFARKDSGRPMPARQVEAIVRKWCSVIEQRPASNVRHRAADPQDGQPKTQLYRQMFECLSLERIKLRLHLFGQARTSL